MKSIISKIANCNTDTERFKIILNNPRKIKILLDNDKTYIEDINSDSEYTSLDQSIGKCVGICTLLKYLSIKTEYV